MPSELTEARQCNLQARGDYKEQAEILRAIKESANEIPDSTRAEEICLREAKEMSLTDAVQHVLAAGDNAVFRVVFPDRQSASSSSDAAGAPGIKMCKNTEKRMPKPE